VPDENHLSWLAARIGGLGIEGEDVRDRPTDEVSLRGRVMLLVNHLSALYFSEGFRGGLIFTALRLCVSLNSRLESNEEEEGLAWARRAAPDMPESSSSKSTPHTSTPTLTPDHI